MRKRRAAANFGGVVLLLVVLTLPSPAAEVAVLRNGFTIRHDHRSAIDQVTRLYLASGSDSYIDVPTAEIVSIEKDDTPVARRAVPRGASASTSDLDAAVRAASSRHQLDSDFISSVIHAESSYNPRAVSPKGAQGLMQLMPGTASKLGVRNPFDPAANVDGGTRYLRELLDYYHDDMAKALAAYNAGPHRVEQYHGVPPYRETHAYVARIIREYNRKKLAERKAQSARKKPAVGSDGQTVSNPTRVPGHSAPKAAGTGS
jgi:soluble lytic murein transglycosylase-like protein